MIDSEFYFKNVIRNVYIEQSGNCGNTLEIPKLNYFGLVFNVREVLDLDEIRYAGFMFFYKVYFGCRAFLSSLKKKFSLNKWYYSVRVQLYMRKSRLYTALSVLMNDIFPFFSHEKVKVEEIEMVKQVHSWSSGVMLSWQIYDVTLFAERRGGVGLFYLKDGIEVKLHVGKYTKHEKQMLKNYLKLWYIRQR